MNIEEFKSYAELVSKKREVKKLLSEIEGMLAMKEAHLLEVMATEGLNSLKVDTSEGSFSIFPRQTLRAGVAEGHTREEAAAVLKAAGMGYLVKEDFNLNSLSSVIREMRDAEKPLPPEFEGVIKVNEFFELSVRRA